MYVYTHINMYLLLFVLSMISHKYGGLEIQNTTKEARKHSINF